MEEDMILVAPKMSELTWHVQPRDQGQIVEVSYASDTRRGGYWRHTLDRSDRSIRFEWLSFDDATGDFEPWNGVVPSGEWMRLWTCDKCGTLAVCNVAEDGDSVLCGACEKR